MKLIKQAKEGCKRMTEHLLFPAHDRKSGKVTTFNLSEEEMNQFYHTSSQDTIGDKIYIKSLNKREYETKLKPFRNSNYKIDEQITTISALKKMYVATITQLNPPAFDDIVAKLIGGSDSPKKKSIKVNLDGELLADIDSIAKSLKINRSDLIEDLLKESMVQIASRMQSYK